MKKKRLDEILMEKGLAPDKGAAFILVTEGRVFMDGQRAVSPATPVGPDARLEVRGGRDYVGRGALKLEAAMKEFKIDATGTVCADIGSATGGFTEVLLKRGAKLVYAIDTARGKLDLKLREDPRVVVMEGTDVRRLDSLPEPIDIATIDVSLIPLEDILPAVLSFLMPRSKVVALYKPQYETRDASLLKRGVIRDDAARERLFENFLQWAEERGWRVEGSMESPIRGDKGNAEYLVLLRYTFTGRS